jgi:multiple sugar transport system permease protein
MTLTRKADVSAEARPGHPSNQGPSSRANRARRRTPLTWLHGGGLWNLAFLAPMLILFGVFSWGPIVQSVVMSFQKTNLIDAPEWVGLDNFVRVLSDPNLGVAVVNTLYFAVLALVLGFPLPLLLAVMMSEVRRGKGLYSALAYLPVVIPPVVAVLLWKVFYNASPDGVFNTVLGWVGIPPQPWLQSAATAMPSLVVEATWAAAGGSIIIYLAALISVPPELYDAAEVDGAGIWRKIWHVTLPQLRGVLFIMLILQIIATSQVFLEPFLFTGGGPNNATLTILLLIYRYAFQNSLGGDYGEATALSLMLAVFLGLLSWLYFKLTERWSSN